jgi:hypothetical protein
MLLAHPCRTTKTGRSAAAAAEGAIDKESVAMLQVIACPDPTCQAPARIVDRWTWGSSDGPVEHVKTEFFSRPAGQPGAAPRPQIALDHLPVGGHTERGAVGPAKVPCGPQADIRLAASPAAAHAADLGLEVWFSPFSSAAGPVVIRAGVGVVG